MKFKLVRSRSFVLVVERVISLISKVIFYYFLIKLLGSNEQGIYNSVLNIANIVVLISVLSIDHSSIYFLSKDFTKETKSEIIYSIFMTMVGSFFIIIFSYLIMLWGTESFSNELANYFFECLLFTFLFLTRQIFRNIIVGLGYPKVQSIAYASFEVICLILYSFTFYYGLGSLKNLIWINIILTSAICIYYFHFISGFTFQLPKMGIALSHIKSIVIYGFQSNIAIVFIAMTFRIDTLFLINNVSFQEISQYSIATIYSEIINLIPTALSVILLSNSAKINENNDWILIDLKKLMVAQLFICLFILRSIVPYSFCIRYGIQKKRFIIIFFDFWQFIFRFW
ncbi:MAG: hypothetical protein IPQ04_03960 [Saprospiraceae bacterium]|nr:hypothetical protein [Saprospiraceae bacterium]